MKSLLTLLVERPLFSRIVNIGVILAGIAALTLLRRDIFPNVSYDTVTVTTLFAGASAEEVEALLTNGLERRIRESNGIRKLVSHSLEGRSTITAQLDPDATTQEKAVVEIRSAVDRFLPSLPEGAEKPLVTADDSSQQPIIELHLSEAPPLQLYSAAKQLKRELELVPGVARVNLLGLPDLELRVETKASTLEKHQLTLLEIAGAIKKRNLAVPGGVVEEPTEKTIGVSGRLLSPADLKATVVRANEAGASLTVGDVATISEMLERPTLIHRTNGRRSVGLVVQKRERADAVDLVAAVKARVEPLLPTLGSMKLEYINDLSIFITRRLSLLTSNFTYGLVLLVLILALFLPARLAFLISTGLPFAILGTLVLFYWGNYTLNLISLIGLIIISGMLIDDAIVVSDSCLRRLKAGASPKDAAIEGTAAVWKSVAASSVATIIAFVPILLMSGQSGKLARQLPLGVVLALSLSLFKTFFILPVDFSRWIRHGETSSSYRWIDRFWDGVLVPVYMSGLHFALRHRIKLLLAGVAVFIGTLSYATKVMPFVLFPSDDIEVFVIAAETPAGTSLEGTERAVAPIESAIAKLPPAELKGYTTQVGFQTNDGGLQARYGSEIAEITVYITPLNERSRSNDEIIESLRELVGSPAALSSVQFIRVNPGMSVGKPVQLAVQANEYADALPVVASLKKSLAGIPGVSGINDSYVTGKHNLTMRIDPQAAAAAGISVEDVGSTLRAAYSGIVPTKMWRHGEEVEIRVALSKEDRATATTWERLRVPSPGGAQVPLSRLGRIEESAKLSDYEHENGRRQIVLGAEVDPSANDALGVAEKLGPTIQALRESHPGVSVVIGGEAAAAAEGMMSLLLTLGLALLGIFLVLILTFQKVSHALLVFISIPLGFIGATWAFALHGRPYTFMGVMGIIALCGVIVNNAVVFLDFVNQFREAGEDSMKSILSTGQLRLRPIFLTTCTTITGILPTAYGIGGADSFVTYIALALSWGLGLGTLMTLFLLPAAVAVLDDLQKVRVKLPRLQWGSREKSVAFYPRA